MKNLKLILPVAGIALGGAAFAGGMATEKAMSGATTTQAAAGQTIPGGGARTSAGQTAGARPTFGTVTAVSGSTVTVRDAMSNAATKITLSDTTTMTDGTATAAASDIEVGAKIAAFGTTAADGTLAATQVQINPTMGAGPGADATQGQPAGNSASGI